MLAPAGLDHPLVYLGIFLGASLLMMWRLEAMLDHGLEGTALGTLLMPYCSGLGNLIFVWLMVSGRSAPGEVLINSLVNNITNLTLLLALPALFWGLAVLPAGGAGKGRKPARGAKAGTAGQLNRLSLLLSLAAALFFAGAVWVLGQDGVLGRTDGLMLIGLFLFWQCFQVFDVLKHNVRQRVSFGVLFYLDLLLVLGSAYGLYASISWLVQWLEAREGGFISGTNLGWLTGWLMVLPNAVLALYWGWKRRADIVYSSQVGDGHICIPLCLGLFAVFRPLPLGSLFEPGMLILLGAAVLNGLSLLLLGGLPRWGGAILAAGYGWFLWRGLLTG
ncbi:MAG: sodium:calcium symporter [Opitutaceae bacterium]|nr:sodium:calcium symporter [Opitutaceae bacterium]